MRIKKTSETRPLASHTVNAYSESESNAYSCDYVNGALDYSTEEVNTHKKWVDGKDIYRKVIYISALPSSTGPATAYSPGITGTINFIKSLTGTTSNGIIMNGNRPENASAEIGLFFDMSSANIMISVGQDRSNLSAYVTLEYTKTTQSTRSVNTYSGDIEEKKDIAIDDGGEEKPIDDENDESNK